MDSRYFLLRCCQMFPRIPWCLYLSWAWLHRCNAIVLEIHLPRLRMVWWHSKLTEWEARAHLAPHDPHVVSWWECRPVRAWAWATHCMRFMRYTWLIQELLFGVRTKRHCSIIKTLFFIALVWYIVISIFFRAMRCNFKPRCCVSNLAFIHAEYYLMSSALIKNKL